MKIAIRKALRERFLLSWKGFCLLVSGVTAIWAVYPFILRYMLNDPTNLGMAGDMFGGITALFSGLAFAGLIFTLLVQKKELQYQREELSHLVKETKETKEHLEAQAIHLKSQSDFVGTQTFENSFFQMLASFNSNIKPINVMFDRSQPNAIGADALEKF